MERALLLAERGRGRTSPNPIVGAVVVSPAGVVVGQGAHLSAGGRHAEVVALDAAGPKASGATLYCTLEPCSHVGRTGPCVERIVASGIRRVVAAVTDLNPKVAGRGFGFLREHGVEVLEGVSREAAGRQHAAHFVWTTSQRPFVVAKVAVSADGFVGRLAGRVALSGAVADRYFHRQRAEVDAIAVGSGTVIADDPRLTARGAYRARPLLRVIVDWRGRVPASARVFSTLSAGPVIMMVSEAAVAGARSHFDALAARGVGVQPFQAPDLARLLEWLAARDVVTLLVEGGPRLHTALADRGLVDRVQWIVTPRRLVRGVSAPTSLEPSAAATVRRVPLGDDVLMEFDVHRTD
jgi:diaminohydroxyphosphoribosylaminopyrimidine deaminase/5-amino-6-(5-phosphoribosylamino)uracil reductase